MTFGKNRFRKNGYELYRFCCKNGYSVIGAASRLLKNFISRVPDFQEITTYANRRWSSGNLYEKIGFSFSHFTEPNYFYFKPGFPKLYSRISFQKRNLQNVLDQFDPNLGEVENVLNNGYRIVYDCGQICYKL
jgi:hypothetical protein